ncbi:triose-phosphate isomerase [Altererythrobacter aurantiacus]|uniref:Triosephosphate isomerase n=1 Tax=Parapontixanthobacter aurantiacus TaxID=1463599 RepID=A0A844ZDY2_9SPHN|nr:triose-phosphate isomerase [Parapontixanthobacter aurantiacus]MXO85366.1 triose-phosphate isomerase [Parapontixanthobacter aurantiacus]
MAERPYIVGNWKMNGTRAMLSEARAIDRASQRYMKVEVALAPPFTLIHAVGREVEQIGVGAQDCHAEPDGAHTGDISATMALDAGAKFVILGHSERRENHDESDALIAKKMAAAFDAGLRVILCCGESAETREAGRAEEFVLGQLRASLPELTDPQQQLTVAYEPIWAIGTGKVPTAGDITAMHGAIRGVLKERYGADNAEAIRILYGGSVKADNAREILDLPDVDGALVGGASLTAENFLGIVLAAVEREDEAN